jgi:hypothetical protein
VCACTPPRRLQFTPKALDDGPVICGLCTAPFTVPGTEGKTGGNGDTSS